MMVFIPHHEQKPAGVQYHFMLETSLPFNIISYWKRLTLDKPHWHSYPLSLELAQELMEGFDGEGLGDEEKEAALADWLRDQGCAVWQN
jgi:hypothetical protein